MDLELPISPIARGLDMGGGLGLHSGMNLSVTATVNAILPPGPDDLDFNDVHAIQEARESKSKAPCMVYVRHSASVRGSADLPQACRRTGL
jgi:hypothetical protein